MMTQGRIRVTSIGHIAHKALLRRPSGFVTGTTRQGVYLQLYRYLTLFLTSDPFRGPLTLNIHDKYGGFASIQPEDTADFTGGAIKFRISRQIIDLQKSLTWKPAPPPTIRKPSSARDIKLCHQVQELVPQHPYLTLLEYATTGESPELGELPGSASQIMQFIKSMKQDKPSDITSEMKLILGAGPGLTPLGDDILLGILLANKRIQINQSWLDSDLNIYHTLISLAKEKTTRLSWSLLSCAIQGSADERIIRVLDGLIAAREIPDHDIENLLDWGSSSGMAVLAGMIMALK